MPKLWLTAKRSSRTAKLDFVVLVAGESLSRWGAWSCSDGTHTAPG